MLKFENWRHFDFWLFGSVIILSIFGIVMIRSAIAGNEQLTPYIQQQVIYVALGLVIILVTAAIDYHFWGSISRFMYFFAVGSLIVIFFTAQVRFGSARSIRVGPILIQPSELAKIVMILVLAESFSRHYLDPRDLKWIGRSFLLTSGVVVWVLLQPNLSTSIVILVIWFSMLWISGLPPRYLAMFVGGALLGGLILFPFLQGYQQLRVVNFLFPDPTARHGDTYNVDQALITVGSGGLFGMGYGHGTQVQLRFLKVRHTDFIFSAMAEEFGFFGTIIVVAMLVFVIVRCLQVARQSNDRFGALIAYGVAVLLFFQTAVNIGVNLNMIPVTGLTLPFISYGGSSILSLVLGIGLVESVALHRRPLDFY